MGDSRMRAGCSTPLTLFAYFAGEAGTHSLSSSSVKDRCAISRPLRQFGHDSVQPQRALFVISSHSDRLEGM